MKENVIVLKQYQAPTVTLTACDEADLLTGSRGDVPWVDLK